MSFDSSCFSYDNWKCNDDREVAEMSEPRFSIGESVKTLAGQVGVVRHMSWMDISEKWSYEVEFVYTDDDENLTENDFYSESELRSA